MNSFSSTGRALLLRRTTTTLEVALNQVGGGLRRLNTFPTLLVRALVMGLIADLSRTSSLPPTRQHHTEPYYCSPSILITALFALALSNDSNGSGRKYNFIQSGGWKLNCKSGRKYYSHSQKYICGSGNCSPSERICCEKCENDDTNFQ